MLRTRSFGELHTLPAALRGAAPVRTRTLSTGGGAAAAAAADGDDDDDDDEANEFGVCMLPTHTPRHTLRSEDAEHRAADASGVGRLARTSVEGTCIGTGERDRSGATAFAQIRVEGTGLASGEGKTSTGLASGEGMTSANATFVLPACVDTRSADDEHDSNEDIVEADSSRRSGSSSSSSSGAGMQVNSNRGSTSGGGGGMQVNLSSGAQANRAVDGGAYCLVTGTTQLHGCHRPNQTHVLALSKLHATRGSVAAAPDARSPDGVVDAATGAEAAAVVEAAVVEAAEMKAEAAAAAEMDVAEMEAAGMEAAGAADAAPFRTAPQVVSIHGPPGVGKSALAIAACTRMVRGDRSSLDGTRCGCSVARGW